MKRFYCISMLLLLFLKGYSQNGNGFINFDNSSYLSTIRIDTTNPNNIWQIGEPDKTIFNAAYSIPNVIITDSINAYPSNNTSIFYLGFTLPGLQPWYYEETDFVFYYKIDCDTLGDYGKIEFSIDTGKTFKNILQYCQYSVTDSNGTLIASNGFGNTTVFTGLSNGWYKFSFMQSQLPYPDTIIYRFTFHSDSIVST